MPEGHRLPEGQEAAAGTVPKFAQKLLGRFVFLFFLSFSFRLWAPGASSNFWPNPLFCRCLALSWIFFSILAFGVFVCFCPRVFRGFWLPRPRRHLGRTLHFAGVLLHWDFFFEFPFLAFAAFFAAVFDAALRSKIKIARITFQHLDFALIPDPR